MIMILLDIFRYRVSVIWDRGPNRCVVIEQNVTMSECYTCVCLTGLCEDTGC